MTEEAVIKRVVEAVQIGVPSGSSCENNGGAANACAASAGQIATSELVGNPSNYVLLGHELTKEGRLEEAEICFRMALAIDPDQAISHNNLGWILSLTGKLYAAECSYREALRLEPHFDLATRNLANLLADLGRFQEADSLWSSLAARCPTDCNLMADVTHTCLKAGELSLASKFAMQNAVIRRGSEWLDVGLKNLPNPDAVQPRPFITTSKLNHDLQQLLYLKRVGALDARLENFIPRIRGLLDEFAIEKASGRIAVTERENAAIGPVIGRLLHLRHAPRVPGSALGSLWSRSEAQAECLQHPLGVVVIDDFLSEEALASLRLFCLESTIWFANRYAHGRLGAFFREGFNCPLLIQLAEELRLALPDIIKAEFPLEQLWAFKYSNRQPKTSAHADFAAVNVNFWITPTEANLDPATGGMLISNIEAPMDWSFEKYNRDSALIEDYLARKNAEWITVPYKANRAIIFNSDLFHVTAPINFAEGYESRRINVTMLYGKREEDCRQQTDSEMSH